MKEKEINNPKENCVQIPLNTSILLIRKNLRLLLTKSWKLPSLSCPGKKKNSSNNTEIAKNSCLATVKYRRNSSQQVKTKNEMPVKFQPTSESKVNPSLFFCMIFYSVKV